MPFQSLTDRLSGRPRDQRGTGLLDVLLGMTIFALLIVIGGQNYSTYTKRATLSALEANVAQVAAAIDQYQTDNGVVPPSATTGSTYNGSATPVPVTYINAGSGASSTNLGALTAKLGPGVSVGQYKVAPAGYLNYDANQYYVLCLVHKDSSGKIDAWAGWLTGRTTPTDTGTGAKSHSAIDTPCGPVVNIP